MLLVAPPFEEEKWHSINRDSGHFRRTIDRYCDTYADAVVSLPEQQVTQSLNWLFRDFDHAEFSQLTLQSAIERELGEEHWEATSKVAALVLLCAMSESLLHKTDPLSAETEKLLGICGDLIPQILVVAIDDHFGLVATTDPGHH